MVTGSGGAVGSAGVGVAPPAVGVGPGPVGVAVGPGVGVAAAPQAPTTSATLTRTAASRIARVITLPSLVSAATGLERSGRSC